MVRAWLCTHLVMKHHLIIQNTMVDPLEFLSGCSGTGMIMTSMIPAGGSAGGGARGDGADPIATMLDGLPGFIAEDITALLRDLPLPAAGDVAGMTVEEAIQVLHTIC